MASFLRRGRAALAAWSGSNARARARLAGRHVVILNYHRVLPRALADRDAVEEAMFVTPESFETHLEALGQLFDVRPLHEITARLLEREPLPPRACAITFDDGWKDNYDFAFPTLRRLGLPATIFVVAERMGTLGAFWPDEVLRSWPSLSMERRRALEDRLGREATRDIDSVVARMKVLPTAVRNEILSSIEEPYSSRTRELMEWSELSALQAAGIDIESHGSTHAILTELDDAEVRGELVRAREILAAHGFGRHRLFAYPSGRFDERVAGLVADTGHAAAFTLVGAVAALDADPMRIPRFGIHDGMGRTRSEFLAKVPGAAFALDPTD